MGKRVFPQPSSGQQVRLRGSSCTVLRPSVGHPCNQSFPSDLGRTGNDRATEDRWSLSLSKKWAATSSPPQPPDEQNRKKKSFEDISPTKRVYWWVDSGSQGKIKVWTIWFIPSNTEDVLGAAKISCMDGSEMSLATPENALKPKPRHG